MFLSDRETASLTPTSYKTAAVIRAFRVKLVWVTALFNVLLWSHDVYRKLLWALRKSFLWYMLFDIVQSLGLSFLMVFITKRIRNNSNLPSCCDINCHICPASFRASSCLPLNPGSWDSDSEGSRQAGLYRFPRFSPRSGFFFSFCSVLALSPHFSFSRSLHLLLQGCQVTPASHQPNEQWYSANSMW